MSLRSIGNSSNFSGGGKRNFYQGGPLPDDNDKSSHVPDPSATPLGNGYNPLDPTKIPIIKIEDL